MSDPITINIDAGWLNRAWACIPKTRDDFKALPGKIAGKFWNSLQWAAYHTQVWLALAAAFIAGVGLSPLFRPHFASYGVPMVEAENVKPPEVRIELSATNKLLEGVQFRQTELAKQVAAMQASAAETKAAVAETYGNVVAIKYFVDHIPDNFTMFDAEKPAQPAVAPAKPKPQPIAKKPPAPTHEAPKPAPVPAEPAALSLPDWIKSKF